MLIEKIKNHLNNQQDNYKSNGLRASNSGKCTRQLAYLYHGFEGQKLNWRARLVFKLGHQIEADLVDIAQHYGLTDMQRECSLEIAGKAISGHIDGILNGDTIVDFKSCTTYSMKAAKKGDVGDYVYQMNFYMHALGLKQALLVYYCKETSALHEVILKYDPLIVNQIIEKFTKVIQSAKDNLPDRDYGPTKTGLLPWQCSYCSYVTQCYENTVMEFTPDGKPQIFINKQKGE